MNLFCVEQQYNLLQHIFANRSESTKLYIFFSLSKLNLKTSSRRLEPDSSQTHQPKTDRLTPDSRQTQIPPDPTIASFVYLATRVATVRTQFQFFPLRTNDVFVQSSVTDIGCYIKSRWITQFYDDISVQNLLFFKSYVPETFQTFRHCFQYIVALRST
jgi:hypothetical protein